MINYSDDEVQTLPRRVKNKTDTQHVVPSHMHVQVLPRTGQLYVTDLLC